MKKPSFGFKALTDAVARTQESAPRVVGRVLPLAHWAYSIAFGKKAASSSSTPLRAPSPQPASRTTSTAKAPAVNVDREKAEQALCNAARDRERARCEAIVTCAAAAGNPSLAKALAFGSRMTRKEAIAMLEATPAVAAADPVNLARAARNPRIGAGGADAPSSQQSASSRMNAALAAESKKASL